MTPRPTPTMSDPYRIVEVKPEWIIDQEDMGTKTKFWYRDPDEDANWRQLKEMV